MGIGPWCIYTSIAENTTEQTYCGKPTPFSMRLCFAPLQLSNVVHEVIQPLDGPTIFQEFLDKQGEGVHHIAEFEKRGFNVAQGGDFCNENKFAFFESEETGTCFETIAFADGYEYPDPDEWFPAEAAGSGER